MASKFYPSFFICNYLTGNIVKNFSKSVSFFGIILTLTVGNSGKFKKVEKFFKKYPNKIPIFL